MKIGARHMTIATQTEIKLALQGHAQRKRRLAKMVFVVDHFRRSEWRRRPNLWKPVRAYFRNAPTRS